MEVKRAEQGVEHKPTIARRVGSGKAVALACIFASPDSVVRIQAMAAAHGHSVAADMLARGVLQEPAEARGR